MSVHDSVLKEHGGTEAVGGEKLGIFLSFGGTLSKSPIVGDPPAKIGARSPNGRDPAGVSMFSRIYTLPNNKSEWSCWMLSNNCLIHFRTDPLPNQSQ
jgi:hypothetical protein